MFHPFTVDQIIKWTGSLWWLFTAVWLGAAPFAKPTIYKQPVWSRLEQIILGGLGLYLLFGSSRIATSRLNDSIFPVTSGIALCGLFLVVCGIAFAIWARLTLGGNWSGTVTLKEGHRIIQRGPYRIVRHPIYTGLLLALLGSALERGLLRSLLGVLICALGLWLKVLAEEQLLVGNFGEEYLIYRRKVRTLVPYLF
jgi:protein-S-isoprenylcysteine O-methyltransferase Ste14